MIAKNQVMPMLVLACPSFASVWSKYCADELFDAELGFIHAGEFARHLIALLTRGETQELAAVFDVVERLHLEGDAYVTNLASVGLLEGIQNNASHSKIDTERFRELLRPASLRAWDELNESQK